MAETVKKASAKPKAAAKPRKTASKAAAENGAASKAPNNVTEIRASETRLSHDQVAQLAHRYWAERGGRDGHHLDDWFRAEQELRSKAS
jgi:Protein of unknown function (DUF2934)